jgi:hypothetical protein
VAPHDKLYLAVLLTETERISGPLSSVPSASFSFRQGERLEALFEELELFGLALTRAPPSDGIQVNSLSLRLAYVERLLQAAEVIPEEEGSEAISAGVSWAKHMEQLLLSAEGLPRIDEVVTNGQRSGRDLKRKPRGCVHVVVTLSVVTELL